MSKRPKLAVLDYGMGNLRSVVKAWEHVGADAVLVQTPAELAGRDALVFPGQGAIVDCMTALRRTGFDHAIREWIAADRPFFGICLGLQALFESSEEGGGTPGLGIFPGSVRRFRFPPEAGLKIPHMGWNPVSFSGDAPTASGLEGASFYFVHSYRAVPVDPTLVWGRTEYGGEAFCSAIRRGRCHATQFHPEKSQAKGLQLYRQYLESL